ncbi:MAG: hypothetical protein RIF33_07315 [Cyclobacteriaceae bacterium]
MPTVITDKTDAASIGQLLSQFNEDEHVDIISSNMSAIEQAIVLNSLEITKVTHNRDFNTFSFHLNNGTVIDKAVNQFSNLAKADEESIMNFEIVGDGVLWKDVPEADLSLKDLIRDELHEKYHLEIA